MNKALIIGNLVNDPELRSTQSGTKVVNFRVAVNRPKQKDREQETDFIPVTCWGSLAENCAKWLSKGKKVAVEGEIRTGSYEKDGRKVYTTDIAARSVEFLTPSASGSGADVHNNVNVDPATGEVIPPPSGPQSFQQVQDDDLPF